MRFQFGLSHLERALDSPKICAREIDAAMPLSREHLHEVVLMWFPAPFPFVGKGVFLKVKSVRRDTSNVRY
jgi:hypothetical protein